LILNVAAVVSVGFVPCVSVVSVTCLRLTHFEFRSRWKTVNLPTNVCAAVTETLNLFLASFFSESTGVVPTDTAGLVTFFCFAW
jgi:hypothetical protein